MFPSLKNDFLAIIVILIITFLAFSPVLKNDFVNWDDPGVLLNNLSIRILDKEHIFDLFTKIVTLVYTPLTFLTYAIEYHFFKYAPFIYHLDNLVLHLFVTLCVYAFFRKLGLSLFSAMCATLFFSVHPSRVESVAWVTERKDVLYGLFYMLACLFYFQHVSSVLKKQRPHLFFLALTFICGTLSILAKPMALSLPIILILLDWYLGRKDRTRMFVEKIPLFLIIGGIAWITYFMNSRIPGQGFVEGFLIWSWTFAFYPRQFLFPFISLPIHRLPYPISLANPEYVISLLILVLFLFSLVRFRRYRGYIFSFLFFFLSIFFLFRFDEVKDVTIVADRFMYLPSLGWCFLLGLGLDKLRGEKKTWSAGVGRLVLITVIAGYISFLSLQTFRQNRIWKDSISLWTHQLKYAPYEHLALNNLGIALRKEPEYKKAEEIFRRKFLAKERGVDLPPSRESAESAFKVAQVLDLFHRSLFFSPGYDMAYHNLGEIYKDLGMYQMAVNSYKKAIDLSPNLKEAYYGLAKAYSEMGFTREAIENYEKNLSVNPEEEDPYIDVVLAYNEALKNDPENKAYLSARDRVVEMFTDLVNKQPTRLTSYYNLGFLYSEIDDYDRAISAYRIVLNKNPRHFKALYNLGNIYKDLGQYKTAIDLYQQALTVDKSESDVFLNLGIVYLKMNQIDKAKDFFEKAKAIDPQAPKAYFNMAYIKEKRGFLSEAAALYIKTIELDPSNEAAYYNLGNVYYRQKKYAQAATSYKAAVQINPEYMDAYVNLSTVSFKMRNYKDAVEYCDEAVLLGYDAPVEYLNTLLPYRN